MKKLKRFVCIFLASLLLAGVTPCQHVLAAGNNDIYTPKGDGKNYDVLGESFDLMLDRINNESFQLGSFDPVAVETHLNNYADRLTGLAALAASGSGGDSSDYSNAIELGKAFDLFRKAYKSKEINIGNNTVDTDFDNKNRALFLHRPDVKDNATTDLEVYEALCNTALEYMYYATTFRQALNQKVSNDEEFTADECQFLKELYDAAEWAGNNDETNQRNKTEHFSFIVDLWYTTGEEGDLGLCELYELSQNMSTSGIVGGMTSVIESDYTQPLHMFYTINGGEAVTGISWESIKGIVADIITPTVDASEEPSEDADAADIALNSAASDSDRSLVSLSADVCKGIAYSASYVPMQTNLYSAATINSYDQDWVRDFHYKYGFMRKALYKDTSATAAMDYYNSRGTQKGNLKVATLRDFMEIGERDLVLYVDDDFYNADDAKEQVEAKTQASLRAYENFVDDLQTYHDTVFGRDETEDSSYVTNEYLMEVYGFDATTFTNKRQLAKELAKHKKILASVVKADSFEEIVKDGDYSQYANNTRQVITDIGGEFEANADNTGKMTLPYGPLADSETIEHVLDGITMREEISAIDEMKGYVYTSYDEYSPLFPYAYVSAIYRNGDTFKVATLNELDTPVFIASDDVAQVRDATAWDRQSIFNYMLVRNLNSMVQIDYTYSLDMDSPVFMDVYGNIITQSGVVIVPAACNSTLYPSDYAQNMYAAGLFLCYGKDWHIPTTYDYVDDVLGTFFYQDFDNEVWLIAGKGINVYGSLTDAIIDNTANETRRENNEEDGPARDLIDVDKSQVDFARMSVYNEATYSALKDAFFNYLCSDGASEDGTGTHVIWPKYVNIINEVMRGAPMEHISLDKEELRTSGVINRTSILAAAKLEALTDSLHSDMSNSLIALPDFNQLNHTEYIVAFFLKFLMIAVVTVCMFCVYRDAVGSKLGLRTFWKCLSSVALTVICLTTIPMLFQLTYYGANKMLLQDEVTKICLYNLEKSQSGIEIGITKTNIPETTNKLMVQLDYVDVEWYDEWDELLFGRGLRAVSEAREDAKRDSQLSYLNDTQFYNDGVYMSVDQIFNSVGMDYTFNVGESDGLQNTVNGLYLYDNGTDQTLSFYSPYYVFLTALTGNVNQYNETHNSYMYTTKQQSGNRTKTVGLCSNYFQSKGFMELDEDILHLREVYDLPKSNYYDTGYLFNPDDLILMSKSRWYNNMDTKGLEKRLEIVNTYCREFVAENREVLDKVSDETFIKVMALSCAMKYNQVFGITEANCFEIYNLESNDLLRLSLAETSDAMLTSPMSYPRFVLSVGGEASVYAASVLEMIMYIGSFIKPICIMIAYISVFLSIFVFRVVLRRESNNLLGYILTVTLLGATNFLHAIIIKVSTYLPSTGLPMLGCIMFIIFGQVVYLLFLGYVTGVALRDWYNLGAVKYQESFEAMRHRRNSKKGDYLSANVPRYKDNWDYYDALVDQHRQRND